MVLITASKVERKRRIPVALVESDPIRLLGFRALLESESNLKLLVATIPEIGIHADIDIVLIRDRCGQPLFDTISALKAMRPHLPVMVIGPSTDHEVIFNFIVSGARGYVLDGTPPGELARAIQAVIGGSVWIPRKVLSMFVERAIAQQSRTRYRVNSGLTEREKQVLNMLVTGLSNKEIGAPLGIVERTVKAHIARMMLKVGVRNRIELSVQAVACSLVSAPLS